MNLTWQHFLATQNLSTEILKDYEQGIYPIAQLGVLSIKGQDAAQFLQGQITCNVYEITTQKSRFSALCNSQGKVISTFLGIRHNDEFLILLPTELLDLIKSHLQKYILRSKVILTDVSDEWCLIGLNDTKNEVNTTLFNTYQEPHKITIAFKKYHLILTDSTQAISLWNHYKSANYMLLNSQQSCYQHISEGIAWLAKETSEQYIPQMLNVDKLEGISFNKGCYTGQEIVARTHYLGQVKRELFLGISDITPPIDTPIINSQTEQVCGRVLQALENTFLMVLNVTDNIQYQLHLNNNKYTLTIIDL